ncbi:hypothetical protein V2J09_023520 [Rumex salicifolius]
MRKQEAMKSQAHTCLLRVDNIHCDGCKGKVRKLLMKIDGVYATSIDMEQGKVAVTGNVDPALLIRKLEKSGKHAEIWRNNHNNFNNNNNKSIQFDALNNQFKSFQMGNVKGGGGGDKKPHYMGGKDHHQIKYQPLVQEMKGSKDLKGPFSMKDQKTVKFDLSKKGHGFDEFSEDDDFEDEDFGDEDEDFDEEFDDEEFGYIGRQHSQKQVNGGRSKNGKLMVVGKEKKGGKKGKKGGGGGGGGGGGFMSMIGKAIGGKGKDGKVGKKCGSAGKIKGSEIQKHGGGRGGGGEGKIGNKGGGVKGYNSNGKKSGGGKNGKFSDFEVTNNHIKGGGYGGGGGREMGQYRAPGVQGPPPPQGTQMMMNMNGGGRGGGGGGNGYYPSAGMGPMGPMTSAGNPYQQQQYMAMMMNQQRMMNVGGGGDMMYHPAPYGRPPPGYGYAPPMVPPSPARAYNQDPYIHMFSDENTDSCSIM